ncbi:MAG TPA: hypothetical protein P5298_04400 [Spirochaetia bacterium]|nr:hypothetical protein [Spirochaetaceae bacterium]HPE88594.1 hypothetical protein [Spirochaetales bacterium]HRW23627.1 hypothetical protein [Spirochaetia bacterium]
MKKIVIVSMMALVAIGAVSAQGFGRGFATAPQAQLAPAPQEIKTIEGKLELVQGHPAIVVKGSTYFVRIPQMLYGFVDGLKEGAAVKLEGYEQAVPYAANSFFFQATKLTIGSRSYDLSQYFGAMGGFGGGMMGGQGYGRGDGQPGRGRW